MDTTRQSARANARSPSSKPAASSSTLTKPPPLLPKSSSSGAVPKTPKPSAAARPADSREEILILGGLLPQGVIHPNIVFLEKDAGVADLPAPPMFSTIDAATPATCFNKDLIIVSGGYDLNTKRSAATVQIFDVGRKIWSNLPDLLYPIQGHGSTILNCNMYCLGGCYVENGEIKNRYNSIHMIELPAGDWIECTTTLPSAVNGPGIATLYDDIVIVGGMTDSGLTAQTSRFNTKNNKLTRCQPLPKPDLVYRSTETDGQHIYVLSREQFLRFDCNNSWSSLAMPVHTCDDSAMVLKQRRLIAMGGFDNRVDWKNPNDRVQVYDLNTKKWDAQKNMPMKLTMHWAVVMKLSS